MNDAVGPDVPEVAPDDELASALADGEAAPAEAARADEPGVARALAAHREVARLVATPVDPPSDDEREQAITAALAAFDRGETDEPAATPAAGDELAARRARRPLPQWVAAVAAALLVLGGLGLLATLSTGGDDDAGTETASLDTDESAATTAAEEAAEGGDAETPTAAAPAFDTAGDAAGAAGGGSASIPYLGEFTSRDDLLAVARTNVAAREVAPDSTLALGTSESAEELAIPCGDSFGTSPASTVLGTATLDGALVTVVVETAGDGTRTLVVFAEPSCEPDRAALQP